MLRAAEVAPALALGLFAGVVVDRFARRPLMIGADLAHAAVLASVPLAWLAGWLRIEWLVAVALLASACTILFDVAYRSYVPTLVSRERLAGANARLQATASVAEVAGFGLAGALVQVLTAPVTVLVDAVSFVASAVSLLLIRRAEPPRPPRVERGSTWRDVVEGVRFVARDPVLRPLTLAGASIELFFGLGSAVYFLYTVGELGVPPAVVGALAAIGGVSSLVGAVLAGRLATRFGLGRTLLAAALVWSLFEFLVPLASGPVAIAALYLAAAQLGDGAVTVIEVNGLTLRQSVTPDRVLGRVNASVRTVSYGAILIGTLAGGALASVIGLRPALFVHAAGFGLAFVFLFFSPVRRLRDYPAPSSAALRA